MSLRKPRADAVLRNLPEVVHADLVHGLVVERWGYKEAREWLKKEHGVTTSIGALGAFWGSDCLTFKLSRARSAAASVKESLAKARPDFDTATIGLISQRAFELMAEPDADAGALAKLVGAINDAHRVDIKREELGLSRRRVALLEEKAEAMRKVLERATSEAKSGGITAATLEEMERKAKIL